MEVQKGTQKLLNHPFWPRYIFWLFPKFQEGFPEKNKDTYKLYIRTFPGASKMRFVNWCNFSLVNETLWDISCFINAVMFQMLEQTKVLVIMFWHPKKRFVNPIKIEVTQRARTETILGKSPAISNGHQPPRADYPYMDILRKSGWQYAQGFWRKS